MVNSSIISEKSIAGLHINLMRFDFDETSRHSEFPTPTNNRDLSLSGLFRHWIPREDTDRASVEPPRCESQIGVHHDREFAHLFAPGRRVCHGILKTYSVDVVLADLKRFLSETESEVVILEIRTEFGHEDPPEFDKYLVEQLGEHLIHQDDHVFTKTVAELLPKRVICVWKPRKSPQPKHGDPLWSAGYLKDNWIDTDLPSTKFESNIKHLSQQQPAACRKFFYRVENTVTPQPDNPILCVRPVTKRIHCYAKVFIIECVKRGCADKLQIHGFHR